MPDVPLNALIQWYPVTSARVYHLQLARDRNFNDIAYDSSNITSTSVLVYGLSSFKNYYWRISATGDRGTSLWSEAWYFRTYDIGTHITDPGAALKDYALHQNRPNPFRESATIRCDLPVRERVRLEIYDLLGQRVLTAADAEYRAGQHQVTISAATLRPGVYLYRLATSSGLLTRKMIVIR